MARASLRSVGLLALARPRSWPPGRRRFAWRGARFCLCVPCSAPRRPAVAGLGVGLRWPRGPSWAGLLFSPCPAPVGSLAGPGKPLVRRVGPSWWPTRPTKSCSKKAQGPFAAFSRWCSNENLAELPPKWVADSRYRRLASLSRGASILGLPSAHPGTIAGMKYTPSALVSEFSGAQGSTVASHNRFGPYFRNRTIPVNPNTALQVASRNLLKAASAAWRVLTDAQRAAWEAVAATIPRVDALGRTYYQDGHQYFVSTCIAVKTYLASAAFPTDPATIVTPVDLTSCVSTLAATIPTFNSVYTATPLAALTKIVLSASPQFSAGIQYVGLNRLRFVQISAAAAASPENGLAAYNALFGTLVAGKKVLIKHQVLSSTGGRSNPTLQLATVGA